MQKVQKVILIISLLGNIVLGIISYRASKYTEPSNKEFISKIDSLELELSILETKRDSIKNRIDTVNTNLKEVEKEYEEIRGNIMDNSICDDYRFFTEYLKKNRERLDSINNSNSAQRN